MRVLSQHEIESVSGSAQELSAAFFVRDDLIFIGGVCIAIAFCLWLCHEC